MRQYQEPLTLDMKICKENLHKYPADCAQCPECKKASIKAWKIANPERTKNPLLKKFGISIEIYTEISNKQHNKCALCKQSETSFDKRANRTRELAVDHCHETGRVRGLLCAACNSAL